jgi:beta-galactosidase
MGMLDRRLEQDSLLINDVPAGARLDILVENNGRINYGPYLTDNRKGILGKVTLSGHEINDWKMYGFPFNDFTAIKFTAKTSGAQPACYKGSFIVKETGDTYLDMRPFGKGFVFLNGRNLGKYWQIGPQQTLYVPAGWLKKGVNEIIVFDALKQDHTSLTALQNPILNQLNVAGK